VAKKRVINPARTRARACLTVGTQRTPADTAGEQTTGFGHGVKHNRNDVLGKRYAASKIDFGPENIGVFGLTSLSGETGDYDSVSVMQLA
jgi:hypothetical protein